MWPFRKGWSKKQKQHQRLCRQEEAELERLINWMSMPSQEPLMNQPATTVPTNDQSSNVGPSDGLPDEFTDNADPKGDACCYQGCRNE